MESFTELEENVQGIIGTEVQVQDNHQTLSKCNHATCATTHTAIKVTTQQQSLAERLIKEEKQEAGNYLVMESVLLREFEDSMDNGSFSKSVSYGNVKSFEENVESFGHRNGKGFDGNEESFGGGNSKSFGNGYSKSSNDGNGMSLNNGNDNTFIEGNSKCFGLSDGSADNMNFAGDEFAMGSNSKKCADTKLHIMVKAEPVAPPETTQTTKTMTTAVKASTMDSNNARAGFKRKRGRPKKGTRVTRIINSQQQTESSSLNSKDNKNSNDLLARKNCRSSVGANKPTLNFSYESVDEKWDTGADSYTKPKRKRQTKIFDDFVADFNTSDEEDDAFLTVPKIHVARRRGRGGGGGRGGSGGSGGRGGKQADPPSMDLFDEDLFSSYIGVFGKKFLIEDDFPSNNLQNEMNESDEDYLSNAEDPNSSPRFKFSVRSMYREAGRTNISSGSASHETGSANNSYALKNSSESGYQEAGTGIRDELEGVLGSNGQTRVRIINTGETEVVDGEECVLYHVTATTGSQSSIVPLRIPKMSALEEEEEEEEEEKCHSEADARGNFQGKSKSGGDFQGATKLDEDFESRGKINIGLRSGGNVTKHFERGRSIRRASESEKKITTSFESKGKEGKIGRGVESVSGMTSKPSTSQCDQGDSVQDAAGLYMHTQSSLGRKKHKLMSQQVSSLRQKYYRALQELRKRPQVYTLADLIYAASGFLSEDQLVFFTLQLKSGSSNMQGIRFSVREKMLALAVYAQSPSMYRWMRTLFHLPSKLILDRWLEGVAKTDPEAAKRLMYHVYTTYIYKS